MSYATHHTPSAEGLMEASVSFYSQCYGYGDHTMQGSQI